MANSVFFCSSCGNEFAKWVGKCPACGSWNTLSEVSSVIRTGKTKSNRRHSLAIKPTTPTQALLSAKNLSFFTNIGEFDRVLGVGITKGGVYLISGQPGIGKSTLLSQLAISLSPTHNNILYTCSEETSAQVASRLKRIAPKVNLDHIQLLESSSVDQITATQNHQADIVIVDSIQSVYSPDNPTTSGTITQIRDCASLLIQHAKETGIPIIIVGHVTKSGGLAGPKLLEHMVDVVLELTGDRHTNLRLLRSVKNRFGPTDEVGLFNMVGSGLEEVTDPSKFLLEGKLDHTPGSALTMIMEGTRPMTIEIQALVTTTNLPIPHRTAKGITTSRLQLICAILSKHLNLTLADKDVFLNITGGITLTEPGADLGIALAIISSYKNKSLPERSVCFGELGLLGELRRVTYQEKRQKEAQKLGYQTIVGPHQYRQIRDIKF